MRHLGASLVLSVALLLAACDVPAGRDFGAASIPEDTRGAPSLPESGDPGEWSTTRAGLAIEATDGELGTQLAVSVFCEESGYTFEGTAPFVERGDSTIADLLLSDVPVGWCAVHVWLVDEEGRALEYCTEQDLWVEVVPRHIVPVLVKLYCTPHAWGAINVSVEFTVVDDLGMPDFDPGKWIRVCSFIDVFFPVERNNTRPFELSHAVRVPELADRVDLQPDGEQALRVVCRAPGPEESLGMIELDTTLSQFDQAWMTATWHLFCYGADQTCETECERRDVRLLDAAPAGACSLVEHEGETRLHMPLADAAAGGCAVDLAAAAGAEALPEPLDLSVLFADPEALVALTFCLDGAPEGPLPVDLFLGAEGANRLRARVSVEPGCQLVALHGRDLTHAEGADGDLDVTALTRLEVVPAATGALAGATLRLLRLGLRCSDEDLNLCLDYADVCGDQTETICDRRDTCDDTTGECLRNYEPPTKLCRSSAGLCDVPDYCTGHSRDCPADAFVPAGTTCRSVAGVCDVAEVCTGLGPACPADGFLAAAVVCRPPAGPCDITEHCRGDGPHCPPDRFRGSETVCRPVDPHNECDRAERCDGLHAACPADRVEPNDRDFFCDEFDGGWRSGWHCAWDCVCDPWVRNDDLGMTPYWQANNTPGDPFCHDYGPPYHNVWVRNVPADLQNRRYRVRAYVQGDFNYDYSQFGLVLWFDQDNYVKLVKIHDGRQRIQVLYEGLGVAGGFHCDFAEAAYMDYTPGGFDELTLEVRPGEGGARRVVARFRGQHIWSYPLPRWPGSPKVGLVSFGFDDVVTPHENVGSADYFVVEPF